MVELSHYRNKIILISRQRKKKKKTKKIISIHIEKNERKGDLFLRRQNIILYIHDLRIEKNIRYNIRSIYLKINVSFGCVARLL